MFLSCSLRRLPVITLSGKCTCMLFLFVVKIYKYKPAEGAQCLFSNRKYIMGSSRVLCYHIKTDKATMSYFSNELPLF